VARQAYACASQPIQVWRFDQRMASDGEAVGTKLIQRDQQHVWAHGRKAYDGRA
jgi:hypothetical protein